MSITILKKLTVLLLCLLLALTAAACIASPAEIALTNLSKESGVSPTAANADTCLTVYVWQMAKGSYSFAALPGHPSLHQRSDLIRLQGIHAEEMAEKLRTCGISPENIVIVPYQHIYSSYIPEIWIYDKDGNVLQSQEDYIANVRQMLGLSQPAAE